MISAKVFSDCSDDDSDSVVTIYRQYEIHKGTHEIRRIIATVCNSSGKRLPKAIVQYYFIGGEKVANSDASTWQCITKYSTLLPNSAKHDACDKARVSEEATVRNISSHA